MKVTPKITGMRPQYIKVPESPVIERLNSIVSGPRCNWETHVGELPNTPSLKPRFGIDPNNPRIMTAQVDGDEYTLVRDRSQEAILHIYNLAKENLR